MIAHRIVGRMAAGLALTILIEGFGAFLLGVRSRRGQLIVLLANLITNPTVQCTLTVVTFFLSPSLYYCFLIPLEIAAAAAEGWIYKDSLTIKMNPFLFALILNAGSYLIGSVIVKLFL